MVERLVNEQVLANTAVITQVDIPIDEARARGAMALFGEKYGDRVRLVEVGEFSRELCGGTHVDSTGEIGLFKILGESSAASSVRRIEAITGEAAYEWVLEMQKALSDSAMVLKSSPRDVVTAIERLQDQLKDERRRREKAEMASLSKPDGEQASTSSLTINGVAIWIRNFGEVEQKLAASALDDAAAKNPNSVGLAAVRIGEKVTFLAKAGPGAVAKGAHMGNLVREVAKIAGGGGGGRPDFATAGGKDASKTDQALHSAESVLAGMLKP
jgi:alanyl-tRNA synthetase